MYTTGSGPTTLYGRGAELARIARLVDGARHGRAGALVVRGPAGVGKSALLDHAGRLAADDPDTPARVLRITGIESEAALPYAALHALLRPALGAVDGLPAPQAEAVRGAFRMGERAGGDRFLVGLGTLGLLADLSPDRPLLCLVDDAQWLDRESADTLLFAVRRLYAEPVVVLFAARDEDPAFAAPGLPVLPLGGLDGTAAAEVVVAAAPGLALAVRDRVVAEAAGNPLALVELSRGLTERQRAGFLGPLGIPTNGSPTSRVRSAFVDRLAALPADTRHAVLVAALDGAGDPDGLSRALGGSLAALAPAERAGLLRVTRAGVVFHHPLVRTAARGASDIGERIAAHRALAEAYEGDQRAWHRAAVTVGPDESVAADLADAGRRAVERGGLAAASAAYERAAELSGEPEPRVRRLVSAATAAADAGQLGRAGQLADRALGHPTDPALAAGLARVRAAVARERRQPVDAARILLAGAVALSGTDPVTAETMLCDASVHVWSATWRPGQADLAQRIAAAARSMAGRAGPALRAVVDLVEGVEWLLSGDSPAHVAMPRPPYADVAGLPFAVRMLHLYLDFVRGDLVALRATGEALVVEARAAGMVGRLPQLLTLLAGGYALAGEYAELAAAVAEGRRVATDTGQDSWSGYLDGLDAWLAAARGDEPACRALAVRARDAAGGTVVQPYAWAGLAEARLDLSLGRYEAALDALRALDTGPVRHSFGLLYVCADQVEAAVRAGRPDAAEYPSGRLVRWAEATGQDRIRALAERSAALLATGDEAESGYLRAIALLPGTSLEAARTRLLYGEWLRRRKRRTEARDQLADAADTFDRLGTPAWYERAAAELRAVGAVPGRRAAADPLAALTAQEAQVVRLAATGASNREIGAQLFLSPRTVGYHLYKAFPKLGVSSRAELPRLCTPPAPTT
ncbi:helix-turn-helix transcriptional regulator [Actinocatenispora rupis]|uniref:Helix-turn-helix transcriptional regulator n=1 Tax=Actinocatenispora rupis TaxID=519421 RepID=A0A8J3J8L1_9ACTN|nr:LuxR family transcriptional regulator [Actinocatenispora rupis]GID12147.1 helix-turn-helix transcriptional regulator [Actinocatenispora rupis]